MNVEKRSAPQKGRGAGADNILSPNHRPLALRKKPGRKTVLGLFIGMTVTGALIILTGLLMLLLPIFKVQKVEVEGLDYYTYEEIYKAAGIHKGDEVLALNAEEIINKIYAECPYVEQAWIEKRPFSVKIIIKEREDVKSVKHGEYTVMFDRDFLVLEVIKGEDERFLSVSMPPLSSVRVGERLRLADGGDTAYVTRLCEALHSKGWYGDVTYADFSGRTTVAFIYKGHIRIEVGTARELDTKLLLAAEVMKEQEKNGVKLSEVYAILDVSNVEESVWKICGGIEELY